MVPRLAVRRYVLLPHNYVVVVGGWGELCCERMWPWVMELNLLGGSVWVVAFDNVVVVFTAFVVSRVVPATQGTFRRRVRLLGAI